MPSRICRIPTLSALTLLSFAAVQPPALATWSIIIVDPESNEIAIGAATCLTGLDLRAALPVVLVDIGAAAAQSLVDFGAFNRMVIHGELLAGTKPSQIISTLAADDSMHQSRQYGIADTLGRTATFTGSLAGSYRGGVIGVNPRGLAYAIQGNVLTGAAVLTGPEQVIQTTDAPLPDLLMSAMEAARAAGGDGRCSCFPDQPTICGSPPPSFEKSAHIGFMIVARSGDTDGGCNAAEGCASGDYFLNLNVAFQAEEDPDPVIQMAQMFADWKSGLVGQPDAYSPRDFNPDYLLAEPGMSSVLTVNLRDYFGNPLSESIRDVLVEHDLSSAGASTIGEVTLLTPDSFEVQLTAGDRAAVDRLRITVDVYGFNRSVVLLPLPTISVYALADLDRDDDVDLADAHHIQDCLTGPQVFKQSLPLCMAFDAQHDGDVDLQDVQRVQRDFTGPRCVKLDIATQPVNRSVNCGSPFSLSVVADAEPPPHYQWYLNDVPIAGANSPTYVVLAATASDFGNYRVRLTSTCGFLDSHTASVTPRTTCP